MKVILFIILLFEINTKLNKAIEIFNKCAKAQVGKTFTYGKDGPDAFDIEGLIKYCSEKAKIRKTAKDITDKIVPENETIPGDIWVKQISYLYLEGIRLEGKENKCICGGYDRKLIIKDCKTEQINNIKTFFVRLKWELV